MPASIIYIYMQFKCTVQNIRDKPIQRGIVYFLICSNRNLPVSDQLPSALNWFICYVLSNNKCSSCYTIVLYRKVNIYIMDNRCEEDLLDLLQKDVRCKKWKVIWRLGLKSLALNIESCKIWIFKDNTHFQVQFSGI